MNTIVKTSESEVKQDRNNRSYKTVAFSEVKHVDTPFGKMLLPASQSKTVKINCYENSYLNKMDAGYADPIFNANNPSLGGWFAGSIETREVVAYDITASDGSTKTVSTYTTIVFGDTDSPAYESTVKAAFKSKGHEIMAEAPVNNNVSALEALRAEIGG
jgi:hypothetical protein